MSTGVEAGSQETKRTKTVENIMLSSMLRAFSWFSGFLLQPFDYIDAGPRNNRRLCLPTV